jgi:hypothetical protein
MKKLNQYSILSLKSLTNGFCDELAKIAGAKTNTNKEKLKNWFKTTSVLAAGYGLGHGTAYAADRYISKELQKMPELSKHKWLGPAIGVGGMISSYAAKKMMESKIKATRQLETRGTNATNKNR